MDLPEEVKVQLRNAQGAVDGLEAASQPFLSASLRDIDAHLDPLQRAQAHLALAQATSSLLRLLLRARGVDPEDHPARKEAKRLAQYSKKVAKAVADKELSESRRSLELNVAAMSRFIAAALPDLTPGQKQALKAAGASEGLEAAPEAAAAGGQSGSERKDQRRPDSHKDAALAFLHETLAEVQPGSCGVEEQARKKKKKKTKPCREGGEQAA